MAHPRSLLARLAVAIVALVAGTCVLPLPDTGAPCDDDGDCVAGLYCEREFFAFETGVCLAGSRSLAATLNQPAVGRNELVVARVGDGDVVGRLQVIDRMATPSSSRHESLPIFPSASSRWMRPVPSPFVPLRRAAPASSLTPASRRRRRGP